MNIIQDDKKGNLKRKVEDKVPNHDQVEILEGGIKAINRPMCARPQVPHSWYILQPCNKASHFSGY